VSGKPLTETEVDAIVSLRAAFENPLQEVQHALETCDDGFPNQHYTKVVAGLTVPVQNRLRNISTFREGGEVS